MSRQPSTPLFSAINPNDLPVRTISGKFFRQTGPRYRAIDLPCKAKGEGRNHRDGREPPMYASSTEDAAWGELFRHHLDVDVSPFEVRRRMSTLEIRELPVLDLTDPAVRAKLGVSEKDLTSNEYETCQQLTELVRRVPGRFGGILQPRRRSTASRRSSCSRSASPTTLRSSRTRS